MFEYFAYKNVKKHQQGKHESEEPVLSPHDEKFLESIVGAEQADPAATQVIQHGTGTDRSLDIIDSGNAPAGAGSNAVAVAGPDTEKADKDKDKSKDKTNRWSFLQRLPTKKGKEKSEDTNGLVKPKEVSKEEQDITIALDKLNLAAQGNSAFSLSKETQALVQKFTLVLKDLINGVPTAYDDLVKLLEDAGPQLQKQYTKLPGFLQKLVKSLPQKLTSNLAPELLAAAAEGQAVGASAGKTGLGATAAKAGMRIPSLKELVMKPGMVATLLRSIMNVLKLRWPAFIGTNALWSVGLFVLLFVFWYCHKRGKETREERERADAEGAAALEGSSKDGAIEGPAANGQAPPQTVPTETHV